MALESWLKISLPAFPVAFAVFVIGWYWDENILALLPPSVALWGLMILYYLFSTWEVPERRSTYYLTISVSILWFASSLTAHNLGKFIASSSYSGVTSALSCKDFWSAYGCAVVGAITGLIQFLRFEPLIVAKADGDRAQYDEENT